MHRSVHLTTLAIVLLAGSTRPASASVSTVAGTNTGVGFNGDGQPATQALVNRPYQGVFDHDGNFFFADVENNRVRRVDAATGFISTVAGNGFNVSGGDGGPATSAGLSRPRGVALDGQGALLIADTGNARIRRVDADGIIATSAILGEPFTLLSAGGDDLLVLSSERILRLDLATSEFVVLAGTGNKQPGFVRFLDGVPATESDLFAALGFDVDTGGNIFIAEVGWNRIRRVDAVTGIIDTIAGGNGLTAFAGDGGPALAGTYQRPQGVAVDRDGNIFVADTDNFRIRRIDAGTGIVTTVAGNGLRLGGGDGGPARLAALDTPSSLTFAADGSLLVSTRSSIRRVPPVDLSANSILGAAPSQVTATSNKNRQMITITVSLFDASLCANPALTLLGVFSNEPDDAPGSADGRSVNDIQGVTVGTADLQFSVRAERSRDGSGRIYEADYLVVCGSGEQVVSSVFITVPL